MFIGYKETSAEPALAMTENHEGIFIYDGKIYFSSCYNDGVNVRKKQVEVEGVDATKDMLWKIENHILSINPLPYIVPAIPTP